MIRLAVAFAVAVAGLAPTAATAASSTLRFADSFRVGTSGVLCTAQARVADPVLASMFDRGYVLVCRDAAAPVGRAFVLRGDATERLVAGRTDGIACDPVAPATIDDIGAVRRARCRAAGGLAYTVMTASRAGATYAVEGLSGYDSALALALRSLVLDRPVTGNVEVSATAAGDPAAFARVQAGSLDPDQALSEAYGRNNSGSYAEAAAFFDILIEGSERNPGGARSTEYLANNALQQSNLGNFAEADTVFRRAIRAADPGDPLQQRMLRNFRAIDRLNRGDPSGALKQLAGPVPSPSDGGLSSTRLAAGYIDRPVAQRLNIQDGVLVKLTGADARLTVEERAEILDAQADYLRGAALRGTGQRAEARLALTRANARFVAVRHGRVQSTAWLRAAILTELAAIAEAEGRMTEARALLDQSVAIYAVEHPSSAALLAQRARIAALLMRQGQNDAAIAAYRDVVAAAPRTPGASQAIRSLVGPYFALLAARPASDTSAAADFFAASQTLARPGVAQTQAVLARELSGGSDAAAALFRQSVTLSRDIVRAESDIGRLTAQPDLSSDDAQVLAAARLRREQLSRDQVAVLAKLADYPRYRAIASDVMPLADLKAKLRKDEGYYKLVIIGDRAFGFLATPTTSAIYPLSISVGRLGATVAKIRDSIIKIDGGVPTTSPFDVVDARKLYVALFGPADATVRDLHHLIFEPDGPMLQLPANLLVTEQGGVDAYLARIAKPDADPFDLTGIAWLGRARMVSTAVSPRAFADVRAIAASKAPKAYLGLGQNALPPPDTAGTPRDPCAWPAETWRHPISPTELTIAAAALKAQGTDTLIGAAFTDDAIRARTDLNQFRVLHFATHGLVTAPRPECPARPALLTSFGGSGSDGLLSFKEIFDLRLDADTVILSACDTAGTATVAATREAGIATGGNFALDGLVRAFVGAGTRTVIASHWAVPDDFKATQRLISGLFAVSRDTSVGEAMRRSSTALMDDPSTSHPYYWSAFAIVGDAARPLQ